MTGVRSHRAEDAPPTKAPFDRVPDFYERAKIRRLYEQGKSALEIGTLAPLNVEHRLLRCQDLVQIALHEDNAIAGWLATGFGW